MNNGFEQKGDQSLKLLVNLLIRMQLHRIAKWSCTVELKKYDSVVESIEGAELQNM